MISLVDFSSQSFLPFSLQPWLTKYVFFLNIISTIHIQQQTVDSTHKYADILANLLIQHFESVNFLPENHFLSLLYLYI